MNLSNEELETLKGYSEGNQYLYDALIACRENGIRTFACCAGHEDNVGKPYIGILIDDKSLPAIRKIIIQLQDMEDVKFDCFVRMITKASQLEFMPDSECRGLTIFGQNSNRCEMFYKIAQAIREDKMKAELKQGKASRFYEGIIRFNNTSYEEIKELVARGEQYKLMDQLNNISNELIKYNIEKGNIWNKYPFFRKIFERVSKTFRKKSQDFCELKSKYTFMQENYEPTIQETLKVNEVEQGTNTITNVPTDVSINQEKQQEGEEK